ncbi:MAG: Fic family protein [Eubacteriales bacterium]|nr:Fic family protein [Eubacteriales bacterium]
MRYFFKIAFDLNRELVEHEYQARINADSTIKLPLYITPYDQSKSFQLYYVPTNEMIKLCCSIYSNNEKLKGIIDGLPGVAKTQFIFESIIAEMQNTNEIEGVSSTRSELVESARSINEPNKRQKRFKGLIDSYFKLVYSNEIKITKVEDVRAIYDELVIDEIKQDEKPDGVIFRKDVTNVTKRTGSNKVIHQGVFPESEIINHLNRLFNFMNDDLFSNLLKIAIQHYYFGYIHPFYDGNGRTSRFISNYLIKKELGTYSAISLSRACNTNSKRYADIFENTNSVRNRGELNVFIEGFLSLLREGQKEVINELKEKKMKLQDVYEKIENRKLFNEKQKKDRDVFISLAQFYLFSDDSGITLKELHEKIRDHDIGSEQRLRMALNYLEAIDLIESRGMKPKYYRVSKSFLN